MMYVNANHVYNRPPPPQISNFAHSYSLEIHKQFCANVDVVVALCKAPIVDRSFDSFTWQKKVNKADKTDEIF